MAEFVLNRNHRLRTMAGHTIHFEKGVPTYVPPAIVREVIAIGGERIDAGQGAEFEESSTAIKEPVGDEREQLIFECFADMIERGAREDFTAQGVPHTKALKETLGFTVSNKERDALWFKYTTRDAEK